MMLPRLSRYLVAWLYYDIQNMVNTQQIQIQMR